MVEILTTNEGPSFGASPSPDTDSSSQKKSNPETSTRWEEYVKPLPIVPYLLVEVEETFNAPGLRDPLLEASHRFDQMYIGWLTVRNLRALEIIGNSPLKAGTEGYHVGFSTNAADVVIKEAILGQKILDREVRNYLYEPERRRIIDGFIHGQRPTLRHLPILNDVFIALLTESRLQVATSRDPLAKKANAEFRETTKALVTGAPPLSYASRDNQLTHAYCLPKITVKNSIKGPELSDVPIQYRDGMLFTVWGGFMGHPSIREILDNPIIMAVAKSNRSFLPPKGSPKRKRIDDSALLHMLEYMARGNPNAVDAFLAKN